MLDEYAELFRELASSGKPDIRRRDCIRQACQRLPQRAQLGAHEQAVHDAVTDT